MSPDLLALFGSGATECESPLLGAKRTLPNVAHFARGQAGNPTAYGGQEVWPCREHQGSAGLPCCLVFTLSRQSVSGTSSRVQPAR